MICQICNRKKLLLDISRVFTYQFSYFGNGFTVPCCCINCSKAVASASEPSQMCTCSGSHSAALRSTNARTWYKKNLYNIIILWSQVLRGSFFDVSLWSSNTSRVVMCFSNSIRVKEKKKFYLLCFPIHPSKWSVLAILILEFEYIRVRC